MKEELKHSVEIERAKVNAAVEQAVEAGKAAAAANKKVKHRIRNGPTARKTPKDSGNYSHAPIGWAQRATGRRRKTI